MLRRCDCDSKPTQAAINARSATGDSVPHSVHFQALEILHLGSIQASQPLRLSSCLCSIASESTATRVSLRSATCTGFEHTT